MTSLNNNNPLNMLTLGSNTHGYVPQFQSQRTSVVGVNNNKLRETIHSGQFMVSDFEPESEVLDEEYEAGMPVPSEPSEDDTKGAGVNYGASGGSNHGGGGNSTQRNSRGQTVSVITLNQKYSNSQTNNTNEGALLLHRFPSSDYHPSLNNHGGTDSRSNYYSKSGPQQTPIIDGSLAKLFQCMSLAYRQKLTSPKWNPFKGVRLRWKEKIRLNNVIWRCWHMQFLLKQKAMVCQFASPLDVDQHNKPEAVVMEGKYWKRKLSTVAAEYKKWRLFYRNRIMGWTHHHPVPDLHPVSLDGFDWNRPGPGQLFGGGPMSNVIFDDELLMDFSDTLFSSLTTQPFAFQNFCELSFVDFGMKSTTPQLSTSSNLQPLTNISHQQQQQHNQNHPLPPDDQMDHQMSSSSMSNSHTLLSQLLTTPGHVHFGGIPGTKSPISSNMSTNQPMSSSSSSHGNQTGVIHMPGTLIDIQQHQQPWNPRNANETISPTASLDFAAKSTMQVQSQGSSNHGMSDSGGGNVLSNTVSPPIEHPPSPPKFLRPKNEHEREHRRVCHINAEQKRRCNIKNGFDMLHSLIPQLSHNPNAKVSKAAMLHKGAEYIKQLKVERAKLKQEIETHRQEVEGLNSAISNCQSMLPATGAPVSRQRTNKMKEMFDQWVRVRTLENWKFWLFSILIRPLLDSYNNAVSTASLDELCRTVLAWVDQHCSLVDLRPAVLNSLRYLCTTTDILTNPGNLPEEASRAVNRLDNTVQQRNSSSSLDSSFGDYYSNNLL